MKKAVFSALASSTLGFAGLAATGAQAQGNQDMGRVISSTPIIQQVAVPRQVCSNQPVAVQQPKSGAGAVMGALAGGAMGNAIGDGGGRAAATILGLVGGALLGDRIEGSPGAQVQNVQQCSTQTFYENRTVAYNVTYEYAGKQYSVQMPQDPGPYVRLQITPVGGSTSSVPQDIYQQQQPIVQAPIQQGPAFIESGVVTVPSTVVYPAGYPAAYPTAVYPAPYYRPYYAPIGLSLNLGYSRGYHRGGGHRHWR